MGAREQFAQANRCDHLAMCFTCGHKHVIAKGEAIGGQPWLDWCTKHRGHATGIIPYRGLNKFADWWRGLFLIPGFAHNADVKTAYGASATYTCTLTGLATDANLLTGRESTGLSNATNKYLDELVAGLITTGTSPTAAKQIEVHAVGSINDTPTYPDVFDGTESAETITSADIKQSICKPVAVIGTSATSNVGYYFAPCGIRQLFGDALPTAHVLFVTHSTGVNLNATATNQALYHTPVYQTVV